MLLGWAVPAPILVEMRELPKTHRPLSNDPEFWNVWINQQDCNIDWKRVAHDWISSPWS